MCQRKKTPTINLPVLEELFVLVLVITSNNGLHESRWQVSLAGVSTVSVLTSSCLLLPLKRTSKIRSTDVCFKKWNVSKRPGKEAFKFSGNRWDQGRGFRKDEIGYLGNRLRIFCPTRCRMLAYFPIAVLQGLGWHFWGENDCKRLSHLFCLPLPVLFNDSNCFEIRKTQTKMWRFDTLLFAGVCAQYICCKCVCVK